MKTILFVGVFNSTSTNNSQAEGFRRLGHNVLTYNYRIRAEEIGAKRRDSELKSLSEDCNIIIFSKCNQVHSSVVQFCNKKATTILWYMDPKNINFNSELIEKIKLCNFSFFALTEPFLEAKKYSTNSFLLQEGFDEKLNLPVSCEYLHEISFIGNLRGVRQKYWDQFKFYNYTNSFGVDHSKAVSETKINLNFTEGGTSDRTYKVLASRGFLLTQPWPEMEKDFTIGVDLDIFQSMEEYASKTAFWLENDEKRLAVAENGYKTVQKYNRTNWAKNILEIAREK